jgi:hypothetical protein
VAFAMVHPSLCGVHCLSSSSTVVIFPLRSKPLNERNGLFMPIMMALRSN